MKLTIFLLTVVILQAHASGMAQSVTLSGKELSLRKVFTVIKQQTGYAVFYNQEVLRNAKPVSLAVRDMPLEDFLEIVFKDQPFDYKIADNTISLFEKRMIKQPTFISTAEESIVAVNGQIVGAEGAPLAGVNVVIKGRKKGAVTSVNGTFSLEISEGDVLDVSFVGLAPISVRLVKNSFVAVGNTESKLLEASASSLVIRMVNATSGLDEVQIVAYGTTSRRFSTGNISTVSSKEIEKSPVTNVLSAIQGRIPGIFIEQSSGFSGSGYRVNVQGKNSLRYDGNRPLYVVDGVPYPSNLLGNVNGETMMEGGSPLNYINPADIESMSVLKDADATSIYGSRAANGAILITTKKGKAGDTRVDVNLTQGWGKAGRTMKVLNTEQFMDMFNESIRNDGINLNVAPWNTQFYKTYTFRALLYDQDRYTDWYKELIGGTAHFTDARIAASGGNGNTNYRVSATYNRHTTVQPGDFSDKHAAFQFNLGNTSRNQRFRVDLTGQYMAGRNDLPAEDLTHVAYEMLPNAPALYNPDGTLNWEPYGSTYIFNNPLAYINRKYWFNTNNLVTNINVSYRLWKDLSLKVLAGYSRMDTKEVEIKPSTIGNPAYASTYNRSGNFANAYIQTWNVEPQLSYRLSKGESLLNFLLGSTFQQTQQWRQAIYAEKFPSDEVMENLLAAGNISIFSNEQSIYKYNAIFLRSEYSYRNRYLFNVNIRRDGSSRFGPKRRFSNFGSVSGAWIFSEEAFIKDQSVLSFGKIKVSYGITGSDQIGDYAYLQNLSPMYSPAPYQPGASGIISAGIANPYLRWEKTAKLNIGIDLGVFHDRLTMGVNYYDNRASNQLLAMPLPSITGSEGMTANMPATVRNNGWEIVLNSTNIRRRDFEWSTDFNITIPRNRLYRFDDLESSTYANDYWLGRSINTQRYYKYEGVNPTTGLYQFLTADGRLTSQPGTGNENKIVLLDNDPQFYGGLQNSFSYKGFQLDVLFQFVKQLGSNFYFGWNLPGITISNTPLDMYKSVWRKPGDNATTQRFGTGIGSIPTGRALRDAYYAAKASDASFTDASYLRMKNVMLSYRMPASLAKRLHIRDLRVYSQGQNLLTFTKYKGYDPETRGLILPPLRMYTLGLQFTL